MGKLERGLQQPALLFDITRWAHRVAERQVGKGKARDAHFIDDVSGRTDDERWNAVRFEVTGGQTHGLMTHRSKRCQHRKVNTIFGKPLTNALGPPVRPSLAVNRGYTCEAWRK